MRKDGEVICLTAEKELRIFMDPLRQRVLAHMEILGAPVTAKGLADALGIAPSSARHHLGQLESIGVVERDHQETIHGIVATFYRLTKKQVRLEAGEQSLWKEQELVLEDRSRLVREGCCRAQRRLDQQLRQLPREKRAAWQRTHGLGTRFEAGVLHLTPGQLRQLDRLIRKWTANCRAPAEGTVPVPYCLVSYEAGGESPGPASSAAGDCGEAPAKERG
jgi:DNA-binding transcriptional ArsR family regulator